MDAAPEFAIVCPSYNNEAYCSQNLSSIANQTYSHFHLYYIDDASTDGTKELVVTYMQAQGLKDKCTLIENKQRRGSLANIYETIQHIDPKKIIVCIDGDDWLFHPKVLETVALAYQDPKIWLTYGCFDSEPSLISTFVEAGLPRDSWKMMPRHFNKEYPEYVTKQNSFRTFIPFLALHLKTFYAKLFQLIKKEDLFYKGNFFPMTGDVAFMMPMLEMASRGHTKCIDEILYIYNVSSPLCDKKVNRKLQEDLEEYIRKLKPYEPLKRLF